MVPTHAKSRKAAGLSSALAVPFLGAALLLGGCGGKAKNVGVPVGNAAGLNANGVTNCKSNDDCPVAEPGYGANMAPAGVFVGWVGEPVDWRIFGIDEKTKNADGTSSARRMAVLLDKVPGGATITPASGEKLTSEASIQYTAESEESGSLEVVIRDKERCEMEHASDKSYCDGYKFLKNYDKRFKNVRWQIKDREKLEEDIANGNISDDTADGVITVSDPGCNGVKATTDGDITKSLMQTFLGALANPAGLAGMATTIFSSGGLTGGGTAGADPTQC